MSLQDDARQVQASQSFHAMQGAVSELQQILLANEKAADAEVALSDNPVPLQIHADGHATRKARLTHHDDALRHQGSLKKIARPGQGAWKQLQKRSSANLKNLGQIFK